jgi:hypothetical protein
MRWPPQVWGVAQEGIPGPHHKPVLASLWMPVHSEVRTVCGSAIEVLNNLNVVLFGVSTPVLNSSCTYKIAGQIDKYGTCLKSN